MTNEVNVEQKARLETMKYFEYTEQEYEENQKAVEDSLYYRKRVLYHSLVELGLSIEQAFKRKGNLG